MILPEEKNMAEDIRRMPDTSGITAFHETFHEPYCVLMDSTYCSMGRMIAVRAARATGRTYYDAVLLLELLDEPGMDTAFMEKCENRLRGGNLTPEEMRGDPELCRLQDAFDRAVRMALENGPCLIHDRAVSERIRSLGYTVFTVLNYASDPAKRLARARRSPGCADCRTDEEYMRRLAEEDNIRRSWHRLHSSTVWGSRDTYDLCLNADTLGQEHAAAILTAAIREDA